jgi:hypothetical protein
MTPFAGFIAGVIYLMAWAISVACMVFFLVCLVRITRALEKIAEKFDTPNHELEEMQQE